MKIRYFFLSAVSAAFLLACACGDGGECRDCYDGYVIVPAYGYFEEISRIPRCTGGEQAISDHLAAFGRSRGFEVLQDTALNVLIRKPGSRGRENESYVILQAHMDMVCRKEDDVEHDFETDPIVPVITADGWITASKRTTLGADNGSGVSIIMAVLASTFSHPPIEALFTADEESGLYGADKFDVDWFYGRRLINLDLTIDGVIVSSSTRSDTGVFVMMETELAALARIRNFPDWPYREVSPLRNSMVEAFINFYGRPPAFAAVNVNRAAVECVVFANKMPDLDQVAIGAEMEDIHTPNERMRLSSYEMLYGYVIKALESFE